MVRFFDSKTYLMMIIIEMLTLSVHVVLLLFFLSWFNLALVLHIYFDTSMIVLQVNLRFVWIDARTLTFDFDDFLHFPFRVVYLDLQNISTLILTLHDKPKFALTEFFSVLRCYCYCCFIYIINCNRRLWSPSEHMMHVFVPNGLDYDL